MAIVKVTVMYYKQSNQVTVNVYAMKLEWKQPWPDWDYQWVKTVGDLIMSSGVNQGGETTFNLPASEYWFEAVEGERTVGPWNRVISEGEENQIYLHLPSPSSIPAKGIITIEAKPVTEAFLNGLSVGKTPVSFNLDAKDYTVTFKGPNSSYTPQLQTVTVKAGSARTLSESFIPPKNWKLFNPYIKRTEVRR